MNVISRHRDGHRLVFLQLDLRVVGTRDVRVGETFGAGELHADGTAGGAPLGQEFGHVADLESEMVHDRAFRRTGRGAIEERDQHVRQLHRRERSLGDDDAAEVVDPHFLLRLDVRGAQVHVPVGNARGVGRRKLCVRRRGERQRQGGRCQKFHLLYPPQLTTTETSSNAESPPSCARHLRTYVPG